MERFRPVPKVINNRHSICMFHQRFPFKEYPGCSCVSSWKPKEYLDLRQTESNSSEIKETYNEST